VGTIVDVKIILATALKCLANSIILCHNHPSGNMMPSDADRKITAKIKMAAELMDITVLDHVIICAGDEYYSFAEHEII
jgi:DNA repair protein RadC